MAGKAGEWTEWSDFENDYIIRNWNTIKNGKRIKTAHISKALCRSYNETKCHIKYMRMTGKINDNAPKQSVWEPEVVTKREFLKEIVDKYELGDKE